MSLMHWLIVLIVVVLVLGVGRLPRIMEDVAHGIKAFKRGMKDEDVQNPPKIDDKKDI